MISSMKSTMRMAESLTIYGIRETKSMYKSGIFSVVRYASVSELVRSREISSKIYTGTSRTEYHEDMELQM